VLYTKVEMPDLALESDRQQIRQVIENWVIWRDSGDWERFATVWHADAWMTATWFQGPAREFIAASRKGFEAGVNILHTLGGSSCDIKDARAVAQTRMTILQRAAIDGVLVDIACVGRFYDFFEKRASRWAIVRRQPIYEKDRLDPVDPSAHVMLDRTLLDRFPDGYRHLAYAQVKSGFTVKDGLPGLRGAAVEKLYNEGRAWLAGSPSPWTGEPGAG
jgi:SnoaL-like domain